MHQGHTALRHEKKNTAFEKNRIEKGFFLVRGKFKGFFKDNNLFY